MQGCNVIFRVPKEIVRLTEYNVKYVIMSLQENAESGDYRQLVQAELHNKQKQRLDRLGTLVRACTFLFGKGCG